MKKIITFVKKETIFTIAMLLGLVTTFIVGSYRKMPSFIDFRTLSILFCLMFIVAGIREQWIFRRLAEKLTEHVGGSKMLELILVLLCFISGMIITNDVALITFVPFTLALYNGAGLQDKIIRTVCLQTVAANLGSMLTPIGNPQNLYLYGQSGMGMGAFVMTMLPLTILSLIILLIIVLCQHNEPIAVNFEKAPAHIDRKKLTGLTILFVICMATVLRILPYYYSLAICIIVGLLFYRNLFKDVDYYLLGTFIGFFLFVGNIQQFPFLSNAISQILSGEEIIVSVLCSQIISNVPATMLLSGFSSDIRGLLFGVNVGGLGTLIASMASLISYKFYAVTKNSKKGKYVLTFTLWNLLFLVIVLPAALLLHKYF